MITLKIYFKLITIRSKSLLVDQMTTGGDCQICKCYPGKVQLHNIIVREE